MIRSFLAGFGALALVGNGSALAADIAPLAPLAAPVSWTGFFVGAHAGAGFGKKKFVDNFPVFDGEIDADARVRGWVAGLQAGFNYQLNWLVVGVEGDFSWADVSRKFSCFSFGDQVCSAKSEWFASVAGRVGIAFGPALLYVKGGAAWVHDVYTDLATCAGNQPRFAGGIPAVCGDTFRGNETRPGWLVGVGFEYAFARNWSAKVEYNYMDFGKRSVDLPSDDGNFFTEEIHQKIHLVKAGINYHFDWATALPLQVRAQASPGAIDTHNGGGHVLAFGGVGFGKKSFDGWAGTLIAITNDLDNSGFRAFLHGGAGTYKYGTGDPIRGTYTAGSLLVGYGFEGNNYTINLLSGVNAENHMLSRFDPTNSVQGTAVGLKLRADAWINPTPQTLVYAEGEYSTAFESYNATLRLGYDITAGRQIFVGPMAAVLGNERFDQWRVGAHVSQLKFGRVQVDLMGGFAHDSIVGDGAFGVVELSANF